MVAKLSSEKKFSETAGFGDTSLKKRKTLFKNENNWQQCVFQLTYFGGPKTGFRSLLGFGVRVDEDS